MFDSNDFNNLTKQAEKQQAYDGSTLVFTSKVIE
jgi:hypothetical protein